MKIGIKSSKKSKSSSQGFNKISVSGYKSLIEEREVEIRPLTIFSGANSSGKSSILQPLLLLKQTLECSYDPGALLINGPNLKFTSSEEFFSKGCQSFTLFIEQDKINRIWLTFFRDENRELRISSLKYQDSRDDEGSILLREGMSKSEIDKAIPKYLKNIQANIKEQEGAAPVWEVRRQKCFLELELTVSKKGNKGILQFPGITPAVLFEDKILSIIHVPGLRGNPERNYPVTNIDTRLPGNFLDYFASIILHWKNKDEAMLQKLNEQLAMLGLTSRTDARRIKDSHVELLIKRTLTARGKNDFVSIADVGIGVSQVLPVLVALLIATPGQLVYIEQPELHLHPKAQVKIAEILAEASKRGVKVVLETHSDIILRTIQSLVAENNISEDLVKLHWFERNNTGQTEIISAELDCIGAFGDWPQDFGDTSLEVEDRYLTAVETKI